MINLNLSQFINNWETPKKIKFIIRALIIMNAFKSCFQINGENHLFSIYADLGSFSEVKAEDFKCINILNVLSPFELLFST